jgi:hypothetical protein
VPDVGSPAPWLLAMWEVVSLPSFLPHTHTQPQSARARTFMRAQLQRHALVNISPKFKGALPSILQGQGRPLLGRGRTQA